MMHIHTYISPSITVGYLHAREWTRATKSHKIQVKQSGGIITSKDITNVWIMALGSPNIQGRQIAKYIMDN